MPGPPRELPARPRAGAGNVVWNANFQAETDIGIDDARGSLCAAHFDAAFFLNGGGVENLIGMRSFREAPRDFQHDGASDAVVPCFGEVAIVRKNGEVRNGDYGITGRNSERGNVCAERAPVSR